MVRPAEDQYYPRTRHFYNGTQEEEQCPKCEHVAQVTGYYAPDRGRNWLKCTNEQCGHEYV